MTTKRQKIQKDKKDKKDNNGQKGKDQKEILILWCQGTFALLQCFIEVEVEEGGNQHKTRHLKNNNEDDDYDHDDDHGDDDDDDDDHAEESGPHEVGVIEEAVSPRSTMNSLLTAIQGVSARSMLRTCVNTVFVL